MSERNAAEGAARGPWRAAGYALGVAYGFLLAGLALYLVGERPVVAVGLLAAIGLVATSKRSRAWWRRASEATVPASGTRRYMLEAWLWDSLSRRGAVLVGAVAAFACDWAFRG